MKKAAFLLVLFSFLACKQEKEKPVETEEISAESKVEAKSVAASNEYVTVYDFEGLEKNLLAKENDTTYVVNFWATWCKPCVKELPYFERLGETRADDKVKVVLVSLDFPEYMDSKIVPFIKENKVRSDVILLDDTDANSWIPKVSEEWTGSIPATLIFRNDMKNFYEQQFTFEQLEKEVNSIL